MTVQGIFEGVFSDNVIHTIVAVLLGVFFLGMMLKPYQNLPNRVDSLEIRMMEQEGKLDLVICFLETEANGGNPLSCSR